MPDALEIRTADIADLELLVQTRMDFCLELHPQDDPEKVRELREKTVRYLERLFQEGRYTGFLGFMNGKAVCCAGLLYYQLPPLIGDLDRQVGHVLTFYTYPGHRGRGIGKALIAFIQNFSKKKGLNELFLNATTMGEPLYREAGFSEPKNKAMVFKVPL